MSDQQDEGQEQAPQGGNPDIETQPPGDGGDGGTVNVNVDQNGGPGGESESSPGGGDAADAQGEPASGPQSNT